MDNLKTEYKTCIKNRWVKIMEKMTKEQAKELLGLTKGFARSLDLTQEEYQEIMQIYKRALARMINDMDDE